MSVNNTKKRLLLILELIYKKTDEENPISTVEIIEYLNDRGITIDRKTLRSDMKLLMDMNYDIVAIEGSPKKFFWGEREFEIPELKMLIDAVSSSRFITKKKSEELINKIAALAGDCRYEQMKKHIKTAEIAKSDNKNLYYIVDTISEAIDQGKKIQFQYTEYNENKEKIFRRNGSVYTLSPYSLYWNEDNYYVVGYYDKRKTVGAFRVDRIYAPRIIDEKAVDMSQDFDINDYASKVFKMFNGKEVMVELECDNTLMKHIIDHYGIDIETRVTTEKTFIARVPAALTPTFYGWVFQFAGKIRIVSPDIAIRQYREMLEKQL